MKSAFNNWNELFRFIDSLCERLDALNPPNHHLKNWRANAWGSNLEMWGELGDAVKKTKQQVDVTSDNITHDLDVLLNEIHRTWPSM